MQAATRNSKAGTGLLEVLIAVCVITIGVGGVFGVCSQMNHMLSLSREETRSVEAAQHVLEIVKTYSWIRLGLMEGVSDFDISENRAFSDISNAACTVEVEPVAGETDRLRRVTVFVTWEGESGTMVSRRLISLVARKRRLK